MQPVAASRLCLFKMFYLSYLMFGGGGHAALHCQSLLIAQCFAG